MLHGVNPLDHEVNSMLQQKREIEVQNLGRRSGSGNSPGPTAPFTVANTFTSLAVTTPRAPGLDNPYKRRVKHSLIRKSLSSFTPGSMTNRDSGSEQTNDNVVAYGPDRRIPDTDFPGSVDSQGQKSPSIQSTTTVRGGDSSRQSTSLIQESSANPMKVYSLQKYGDWRQEKLSHADILQRLTKLDLDPLGVLDRKLDLPMKLQTRIEAIQTKVNSEEANSKQYEWNLRQLELKHRRLAGLSVGRSWAFLAIIVYLERESQQLQPGHSDSVDHLDQQHPNLTDIQEYPESCFVDDRSHDFTWPEKTQSQTWKCSVEGCKYSQYGWTSEEELDRHYKDKHNTIPLMYRCFFPPCQYQSKRQSDCERHMGAMHNWNYDRPTTTGKRVDAKAADIIDDQAPGCVVEGLLTPNRDFVRTEKMAIPYKLEPTQPRRKRRRGVDWPARADYNSKPIGSDEKKEEDNAQGRVQVTARFQQLQLDLSPRGVEIVVDSSTSPNQTTSELMPAEAAPMLFRPAASSRSMPARSSLPGPPGEAGSIEREFGPMFSGIGNVGSGGLHLNTSSDSSISAPGRDRVGMDYFTVELPIEKLDADQEEDNLDAESKSVQVTRKESYALELKRLSDNKQHRQRQRQQQMLQQQQQMLQRQQQQRQQQAQYSRRHYSPAVPNSERPAGRFPPLHDAYEGPSMNPGIQDNKVFTSDISDRRGSGQVHSTAASDSSESDDEYLENKARTRKRLHVEMSDDQEQIDDDEPVSHSDLTGGLNRLIRHQALASSPASSLVCPKGVKDLDEEEPLLGDDDYFQEDAGLPTIKFRSPRDYASSDSSADISNPGNSTQKTQQIGGTSPTAVNFDKHEDTLMQPPLPGEREHRVQGAAPETELDDDLIKQLMLLLTPARPDLHSMESSSAGGVEGEALSSSLERFLEMSSISSVGIV